MTSSTLRFIATIISHIFEPMIMLLIITVLAGINAQLTAGDFLIYLGILLFAMALPIIGFRFWYMKRSGADWDLHDRKKRVFPVFVQVVLTLVYTLIVHLAFHNALLTQVYVLFSVWIFVFFLVTTRWKISGHSGTLALATGLVVSWYGWGWWPVLLFVPLVSWARIIRRDHTLGQVIAGASYSWFLVYLAAQTSY